MPEVWRNDECCGAAWEFEQGEGQDAYQGGDCPPHGAPECRPQTSLAGKDRRDASGVKKRAVRRVIICFDETEVMGLLI